jgi:hypothetical protein
LFEAVGGFVAALLVPAEDRHVRAALRERAEIPRPIPRFPPVTMTLNPLTENASVILLIGFGIMMLPFVCEMCLISWLKIRVPVLKGAGRNIAP